MQSRSSTDQKWVTYVVVMFTYTLAVVKDDWLSALLFLLLLCQFAGLLRRHWMFILAETVLIFDFIIKSPILPKYLGIRVDTDKLRLDSSCVSSLFQKQIKPQIFLYIGVQIYNLYLCIYYFVYRNKVVNIKTWGPLMTQVMVFTLPILIYLLSLISLYWPIKVAWGVLGCFQLLNVSPRISHLLSCVLIAIYFFLPDIDPQYGIDIHVNGELLVTQDSMNRIVQSIFVLLMIQFNVYSNPHPDYKQSSKKQNQLKESARKIARRVLQQQMQKQKVKAILTLAFAVVLCLITTSIGNIFIIFGIYSNLPSFKSKRFFAIMGFGIVLSILFEPEQIAYFVYLYTIILVVGHDIGSSNIIRFQTHSYSFVLNFYRLYIMLSHVSFLNWVITIFNKSFMVTMALSVRIFCRYFNYVSVFLGTNDNYGFDKTFLNLRALPDSVLIIYLILLRLYSAQKTKTYESSTITNVLLQYPILAKIKKVLIVFRFFNWISYIIFSLIILSRRPSLYITIHIFFLVLILICDTIKTQNFPKNRVIKNLWVINFYATMIMLFTKYFYFLKQYQSNSQFMDYLLATLTKYKFLIGLDELFKQTQGFALAKYFLYDGAVLVLSWVNIYVYEFKLYYGSRKSQVANTQQIDERIEDTLKYLLEQITKQNEQKQRQYFKSNQYLEQQKKKQQILQKKLSYNIELEKAKYSDIDYFYHKFIKPVDITTYLANHQYKIMEKVIRDCLLDLCFAIFVLAFYLQKQNIQYIFYLPYFVISAYAYYQRFTSTQTLEFTNKILSYSTAWSFIMLFASYLYITYLQMHDEQIPTALVKVYITYILCIIVCVLYKLSCVVPDRQPQQKDYHCIIYLFFPFAVQSNKLWTQILSIFSQFWLTFTMSLFFTNIFSPRIISTFIHPFVVVFLLVKKISKQKSQYWLYIVCLVSILDIWNYDFFAYTTVLSTTIFYAVKTAQKMSQQNQNGFRENNRKSSELSQSQVQVQQQLNQEEQKVLKQDSQQKKWPYYIAYCTIIWMLPQILSLLWMFGVVWLSPSIIATILIIFSYVALLYQLLLQNYTQISQPLMKITLGITLVFFCYELFTYVYAFLFPQTSFFNHSQLGLFLIFQSCFFYLALKKRAVWFTKRINDAKIYWKQKTQLIGQLGSQLHNQKKLITLQRYYSSKQRLTQKVNKISQHLKNNGGKAYFQSLDNILKTREQEQGTYELYTNMLIFLDINILKKCFLMLNQYVSVNKNQNLIEKAKNFRTQIYRIYQRSFVEAFNRYTNQLQNKQESVRQGSVLSLSRSSTINLQRINEINQRYKKCFQMITKNTEKFNTVLRYIIQNFQIISMMIVIGWNLFGGVYTIPANIIIFGWAVVLENKTTVTFWILIMSYVCLILLFKQIISYIPDNSFVNFVFYYHAEDYLYEFLIIVVSVVQITFIKLGGTRYKTYSERQSIYDAFYRAALNKAANGSQLDKEQDFMEIYKNLAEPQKHSFLYRVFSKSRFKPGKDFYPLMSGIQLFILLYIFFFYDMMQFQSRKNRKSIGELLTVNQFSSHMVKALFLQVMVMVIDRLIISLNLVDQDNQILQNFFLSFTFSLTQVKRPPPKKLDKVGIFDLLLVLKYLFHLFLLIMINFFIYFYIPSAGLTKSLIPSCTGSQCHKSYTYLSIFLILYFFYFLISGLQIKHGFNRNKCKNVLMQKFHYVNYYIYKTFTAIPFAWQFKKICDWTVTSTALPLFHWMKFEDINARLYQSKCQAQMIKLKPLGTPWNKYLIGPNAFLIILLLAFSPFIIYSSVNPFAVKDSVIGAKIDIYLNMDDRYDYKFFSTSHATVTQATSQNFEINLTDQDIFLIKLSKYPDQNFLLSQPVIQKLAQKIHQSVINKEHKFSFVLNLNTIQQEGGQSKIEWSRKYLSPKQLLSLYQLLKLNKTQLVIQRFYSPFPGQLQEQSILIRTPSAGQYFQVSLYKKQNTLDSDPINKQANQQIYFYYLTSNKYKISLGILTFYVTYILVISRLLRFYLTGTIRNIFYSGCYLQSILVLCEAVRQARIVQNFIQEESFYFQLVDIMRHPKALKQITGDYLTFRKKYI